MGNTCACTNGFRKVSSSQMRKQSSVECGAASAREGAPSSSAQSLLVSAQSLLVPSMKSIADRVVARMAERMLESGGDSSSMLQHIEESRSHWSLLSESELYFTEEEVAEDNKKVFAALQSDPTIGHFFRTFGYDTEVCPQCGALVIGEKFAEGGQAELFHAEITWKNPRDNERDHNEGLEWVLKVFKKGTLLRHLQLQWPKGMFQIDAELRERLKCIPFKPIPRFLCDVLTGVLLEDGRFAFLMEKEMCDLRSLIDEGMIMRNDKNQRPFRKEDVEQIMFDIAVGMSWLHSHNIVHRDLKASNVLVKVHNERTLQCFIADYECSIGVVGTNFFRAPEILAACKDKSISKKEELFTMSSDVYSYGMTCYEILTGKLPFDGHRNNDYDVLSGGKLEVPSYVDGWIRELLCRCWQVNPSSRPTFEEISNLVLANSKHVREVVECSSYEFAGIDWIKWEMEVH